MAPRAVWKGQIKVGELACPVSLYTAVSTSERIAFHTINRGTGHRVRRQFVDAETGAPVSPEDQVKGYELPGGGTVILEPTEIAAALPEADHTLAVESFIPCGAIDDLYLDRPYYLVPGGDAAAQAFAVLREGMRGRKVAALARAVMFRRVRTVLVRAHDTGLIATLLNFDYEVRAAAQAFAGVSELSIRGEMLDLAKHIIQTKLGRFDPKTFDDRYEGAVAEVVRAKAEGRAVALPAAAGPQRTVVSLLDALRESAKASAAGQTTPAAAKPRKPAKTAAKREPAAAKPAATAATRRKAG